MLAPREPMVAVLGVKPDPEKPDDPKLLSLAVAGHRSPSPSRVKVVPTPIPTIRPRGAPGQFRNARGGRISRDRLSLHGFVAAVRIVKIVRLAVVDPQA